MPQSPNCSQADDDAGCCQSGGWVPDLPDTEFAPGPIPPLAMTACKAAPLIQKMIA